MGRLSHGLIFGLMLLAAAAFSGAGVAEAANTVTVVNAQGCTGDQIVVTVNLNNATLPVDAFGMHFNYNPSQLAYVSCQPGTLNPGWMFFDCNSTVEGDIGIGAFALSAIPMNSTGSLVQLTFNVTCTGCFPGITSPLTIDRLVDDLDPRAPPAGGLGVAVNGTFTFVCPTATPQFSPTPAPIPAMGMTGSALLIALLGLALLIRRK